MNLDLPSGRELVEANYARLEAKIAEQHAEIKQVGESALYWNVEYFKAKKEIGRLKAQLVKER